MAPPHKNTNSKTFNLSKSSPSLQQQTAQDILTKLSRPMRDEQGWQLTNQRPRDWGRAVQQTGVAWHINQVSLSIPRNNLQIIFFFSKLAYSQLSWSKNQIYWIVQYVCWKIPIAFWPYFMKLISLTRKILKIFHIFKRRKYTRNLLTAVDR